MRAAVADPKRSLDSEQISPETIAHHTVYEKTPNLHQSHICQWGTQPYLVGPLSRLVGKPPLSPWLSNNVLPLTKLFAGALARQGDKRLLKRLFAERLEEGEDPGHGQPAQHCWQKSLRDDFKAFGALHGSTPTDRRNFGVDRLVWTEAARKGEGVPWYKGVLLGAERFVASWHKSEEEANKLREVNRAA